MIVAQRHWSVSVCVIGKDLKEAIIAQPPGHSHWVSDPSAVTESNTQPDTNCYYLPSGCRAPGTRLSAWVILLDPHNSCREEGGLFI